jgi:transposase InsO family protein
MQNSLFRSWDYDKSIEKIKDNQKINIKKKLMQNGKIARSWNLDKTIVERWNYEKKSQKDLKKIKARKKH